MYIFFFNSFSNPYTKQKLNTVTPPDMKREQTISCTEKLLDLMILIKLKLPFNFVS